MKHLIWRLALSGLVVLSTSCEQVRRYQVQGTYTRMGEPSPFTINEFELTETKFSMTVPLSGRVALDYDLQGDDLYVGGKQGPQIHFRWEGHGILKQEGTSGFDGRFIKLRR